MPGSLGFVPSHFQVKYQSVWEHEFQQQISTLRNAVDVDSSASGKSIEGPILDSFEMMDDVTRGGDTILSDMGSDIWNVYPAPAYDAKEIPRWDDAYLNQLVSPKSEVAAGQAYAVNRKLDNRIVTAATGIARRGENGVDSVALPASQIVPTTWQGTNNAAAAGPLNWYKINRAAFLLNEAEVPDSDRYFWLDAFNLQALVDDIIKNHATVRDSITDMTTDGLLRNGLLNFHFIRTERLETDANDITSCVANHKSAIKLGIWGDRSTIMQEVITRKRALWIYTDVNAGATRKKDLGVVSILCDRSP
jgi:hypothetical protein